jgi:pyrroloquinoline quinone (PQQ) biosynthesis protein C
MDPARRTSEYAGMTTHLHSASRPLLSTRARTLTSDGQLTVDTPEIELTFTGSSAAILAPVLGRLDGRCRVDEISAQLGLSERELKTTLQVLADEQVVIDAGAAFDACSPKAFLDAYFAECRFLSKEIFAQPFWEVFLSGRAERNLVLGWGIEFYHFVDAANEHMAAAVALCRDGAQTRAWLAKHYVEERDHGSIFLDGLAGVGLDRDLVRRAPPLPSTRALINYLTELASADTLAYAGTFGVMQANREEATRDAVGQFFTFLSGKYPFAVPLFDAFRQHALMDVDLEHQHLVLELMCEGYKELPRGVLARPINAARSAAEHFMMFFESIHQYYGSAGAELPRSAFDVRLVR